MRPSPHGHLLASPLGPLPHLRAGLPRVKPLPNDLGALRPKCTNRARGCTGTRSDMVSVLENTFQSGSPAFLEGLRAGALDAGGSLVPPDTRVAAAGPPGACESRLTRGLTVIFRYEMPPPRDAGAACSYKANCMALTVGEYFDLHPGPGSCARGDLAAELRACRCWIEGIRPYGDTPPRRSSLRVHRRARLRRTGPRPLRARHDASLPRERS